MPNLKKYEFVDCRWISCKVNCKNEWNGCEWDGCEWDGSEWGDWY